MRISYLTAALVALAAPATPDVAAAPAQAATQCGAKETPLYTCAFGKSLASICTSTGQVYYRFGPPRRPTLAIASTADWSNVHHGAITGGGGGWQKHLRFTTAGHDYVVYWATGGRLTEVPGKRWSGIYVSRGDREIASLKCRSGAHPVENWEVILENNRPTGVTAIPSDPDPRFELWF